MRAVTVVFLALTLAWLSQACSVAADGVHSLGGALTSRCGWIDDGYPPMSGKWVTASADRQCGFLPLGVDPCGDTPWQNVTNDGVTQITTWHQFASDCGDYRIEWAK